MDLDEFVTQSLLHISRGVRRSQEEIRAMGGYANPAMYATASGGAADNHFGYVDNGHNVLLVDFDVAVTVSDAAEGGAGGKISVVRIFSAGAGGKLTTGSESTSRIQFKVPLALPVDEITKEKLDRRKTEKIEATRRSNANSNW